MKWLTILTGAVLALTTQAVLAQEQEVRGEVVEVQADANELTIRVTESDEGRPARVGQTETYTVPPGTSIEVEGDDYGFTSVTRTPGEEIQLGDLVAGDPVIITFEESAAGRQATRVRQSGTETDQQQSQQVAQQDRQQQDRDDAAGYGEETQARDQLPGSASPLPLIALAGIGFAFVAGALRLRRRR